jgi:hypothetical protein
MRHGPPPPGVKWYGIEQRIHIVSSESRAWTDRIAADCKKAVEDAQQLSHFSYYWRYNHALHIKNKFLEWCRHAKQNDILNT